MGLCVLASAVVAGVFIVVHCQQKAALASFADRLSAIKLPEGVEKVAEGRIVCKGGNAGFPYLAAAVLLRTRNKDVYAYDDYYERKIETPECAEGDEESIVEAFHGDARNVNLCNITGLYESNGDAAIPLKAVRYSKQYHYFMIYSSCMDNHYIFYGI